MVFTSTRQKLRPLLIGLNQPTCKVCSDFWVSAISFVASYIGSPKWSLPWLNWRAKMYSLRGLLRRGTPLQSSNHLWLLHHVCTYLIARLMTVSKYTLTLVLKRSVVYYISVLMVYTVRVPSTRAAYPAQRKIIAPQIVSYWLLWIVYAHFDITYMVFHLLYVQTMLRSSITLVNHMFLAELPGG